MSRLQPVSHSLSSNWKTWAYGSAALLAGGAIAMTPPGAAAALAISALPGVASVLGSATGVVATGVVAAGSAALLFGAGFIANQANVSGAFRRLFERMDAALGWMREEDNDAEAGYYDGYGEQNQMRGLIEVPGYENEQPASPSTEYSSVNTFPSATEQQQVRRRASTGAGTGLFSPQEQERRTPDSDDTAQSGFQP